MKNFTKSLNKESKNSGRTFSVKEYLAKGANPKKALEAMVKEVVAAGQNCDGLVISGHHTGSFGGKRASGRVSLSDFEALGCKEEYMPFFAGVGSLWLQGCRTIGDGRMVCEAPQVTQIQNADEQAERLAHHDLNADGFRISALDMSNDYTQVTSAKNPYGGRWVRNFPKATVHGWTGTAPGERAQSQRSIPYHIANFIEQESGEYPEHLGFLVDEEKQAINLKMNKKSTMAYSSAFAKMLCGDSKSCKAWISHGNHRATSVYGFSNDDLNSFPSLSSTNNEDLLYAKKIECALREAKTSEEKIEVLTNALKNESTIGYAFDTIMDVLSIEKKRNSDVHDKLIVKLKENGKFSKHILRTLFPGEDESPPGVFDAIKYYAFWRDYLNDGNNHPQVRGNIEKGIFERLNSPYEPEGHGFNEQELRQRRYFLDDYKESLISLANKYGIFDYEDDEKLLKKIIKSKDLGTNVVYNIFNTIRVNPKEYGIPIFVEVLLNGNYVDRKRALQALGRVKGGFLAAVPDVFERFRGGKYISYDEKKLLSEVVVKAGEAAVPFLVKKLNEKDLSSRKTALALLGDLDEKSISAFEEISKSLEDEDREIKMLAMKSLGHFAGSAESAVPELIKLIDEKYPVGDEAGRTLGKIGKVALPFLIKELNKEGVSDRFKNVAIGLFGRVGGGSPEVLYELRKVLESEKVSRGFKINAAQSLAKIEMVDEKTIISLIALVGNDPFLNKHVIKVLGELGSVSEQPSPVLVNFLIDELSRTHSRERYRLTDKYVVKEALIKIGKGAYSFIVKEMKTYNPWESSVVRRQLNDIKYRIEKSGELGESE